VGGLPPALEVPHHRLRIERCPVVELHVAAQRKRLGARLRRDLPLLRERRLYVGGGAPVLHQPDADLTRDARRDAVGDDGRDRAAPALPARRTRTTARRRRRRQGGGQGRSRTQACRVSKLRDRLSWSGPRWPSPSRACMRHWSGGACHTRSVSRPTTCWSGPSGTSSPAPAAGQATPRWCATGASRIRLRPGTGRGG